MSPIAGISETLRVPATVGTGGASGSWSFTHGALWKQSASIAVASGRSYGGFNTKVFDTDNYYKAFPGGADQLNIGGTYHGGPAGNYYAFGSWSYTCDSTPSLQSYTVGGVTYYYGDVMCLGFIGTGFSSYIQPLVSTLAMEINSTQVWTVGWEWFGALASGAVVQNPLENDQNVGLHTVAGQGYFGLIMIG